MTSEPPMSEDGTGERPPPPAQDLHGDVATTASGLEIPRIGLGTWQLRDDAATTAVHTALELGYRHIDTAQMYGNEAAVGRALAASSVPREDVFVTTKIDNDNHEPGDVVTSTRASLDRLGLDFVDLLLVHWPANWNRIGATMAALAQVQSAGLCRAVGVSNFTLEQLDDVVDMAPLQVLQAECHPFLRQEELRAWCTARGWAFVAYSPIAQNAVADHPDLSEIASRHDTSPAGIALAWLMHQPHVAAIPRSSDRDHLEQNLHAATIRLEADDLATISAIEREMRVVDPESAPW